MSSRRAAVTQAEITRRIRSDAAAAMLGLTARGVQSMASRGDLPGAAKIGKVWTFDPAKLRRFIEAKESECPRKISTKEKASGGFRQKSTGSDTGKAFARAMSKLLGDGETRASKR
jgi:hypothetical protein